MQKILLGPAGSPAKSTIEGVDVVKKLGLQAMEVEFVRGVKMRNQLAKKVGELAKKLNISLSIHAPYFINLTSEEKIKIKQSKKRILDSCERGSFFPSENGKTLVVFHAAYYGKNSPKEEFKLVEKEIKDMMKTIRSKKWNVELAPETTGKITQFGTLDELIELSKKTKCGICIDPAHIYARNQGKIDFKELFDKIEELKRNHYHFHFSGIKYTKKGEWYHLPLSKPDFAPFAKEILKRKLNVTIISESPITWKDSLKMKKIFERLGYKF